MKPRLLIYGATGYTGGLIARRAVERGLAPILAGRREAALSEVGRELGASCRVASLEDADAVERMLRNVDVVVNAAGPFSRTAVPLADACLRAGAHYLDITGEISVIESLRERHAIARARERMLMPGVGFDVIPTDCLALHVAGRLPSAVHLALSLAPLAFATPGSMKTFMEHAGDPVWVRRGGELVGVAPGTLRREIDFGDRLGTGVAVNWGDVATAYYTTGIPDVEVYFESTGPLEAVLTASRFFGRWLDSPPSKAWVGFHLDMLPDGPTPEERASARTEIVAEVEDEAGRRATSRLSAPEAYAFTSQSAVHIAERVLEGDLEPGFQTPARVYGADLVLSFPGVSREDVPLDGARAEGSRRPDAGELLRP